MPPAGSLSEAQKARLDEFLLDADPATGFTGLKADPGKANLENILTAAKRLEFLRSLALPAGLLDGGGDAVSRSFRRRVANETPWEMRRHPADRRHALYALFLAHREREITDGLTDLLIETVHQIASQAKHTVVKRIAEEIEKVEGKERILVRIAEAAWPIQRARCAMSCSRWPAWTRCRRSSANTRRRAPSSARCMPRYAPPTPGITGGCCPRCCRPCSSTRTTRCIGP